LNFSYLRHSLLVAESANTVPARKMNVGAYQWVTNLAKNQVRLAKTGLLPKISSLP